MIVAMTTAVAAGTEAQAMPYTSIEVSPSVVVAFHTSGSNISCVALEDGLVFVDASLSTRTASRFRRDMEERFDRPAAALVLTHAHLDHLLGMGAFADVPVYAAAAGRPRWEHLLAVEWDEKAVQGYGAVFPTIEDELPDARMRLPTDWFDDELVLGSGDGRLVVRRTGGHTIDSSSVFFATDKIVVAGDLVQARRRPYFGEPDTDFSAWIESLKRWEDIEVKAVCPGHGPVIEVDELREIRIWLEKVWAAVGTLKDRGVTLEEIISDAELPAGYWPDEESVPRWWGHCVKRLYDAS